MDYYKGARYSVCTANPELAPLVVYEIEQGTFNTSAPAIALQKKLSREGKASQIIKREWLEVSRDFCWMSANAP